MKTNSSPFRIVSLAPVRGQRRRHLWEWTRLKSDSKVMAGLSVRFVPSDARGNVTLRIKATYTAMREGLLRPLLDYEMEAVFAVEGAPDPAVLTDVAVYLPTDLLGVMLQVSVGALRGMLASELQGTPLERHPLPLYDITALVGHLRA